MTARELGPNENTSDGSMLISLHRPQNQITESERADFLSLYQGTKNLVDEAVYGPGNYYQEITYTESEFDGRMPPGIFNSIQGYENRE